MYSGSSTPCREVMFRKILATLVVVCVFSVLVLCVTTGIVVTVVLSTAEELNTTVIDDGAVTTGTERHTTTAHRDVTYAPTPNSTSTTAAATTAVVTTTTTRPETTQATTTTTITTTSSVPQCLLKNVELIVRKSCWVLQMDAIKGCQYSLKTDLTQIVVSETQTSNCHSMEQCLDLLRMIMTNYLDQYYRDINYNFVITGDGSIYEGRSWYCKVKDNIPPRSTTIHVGFTGNSVDEVTDEQVNSLQKLLDYGNKIGHFKYNKYKLKPYCCVIASSNPSRYVIELIENKAGFDSNCKETPNCKWKN